MTSWQRSHEDHKRHGTQKAAILAHLREGRPLTQDEGRALCGAMRVASRVSELRKDGHLILTLRNAAGVAVYVWLAGPGGDGE